MGETSQPQPHAQNTALRDRQWFILDRWQQYEGEARANLLRILGIAAFYAVELLNYYGLKLGALEIPAAADRDFHVAVTMVASGWTLVSLGTLLSLRRQIFPAALKFVTTAADVAFLTTILMLADGPRSPLVIAYPLIVVLAALRLDLRLVWFATCGAMGGYLALLAYARWYAAPRELNVPRYVELIVLLAIVLTGIALGQIVRRVRRIAQQYADRLAQTGERAA